jgi:hypothetical protein
VIASLSGHGNPRPVIPAQAGIQNNMAANRWTPVWPFLETWLFSLVFTGVTQLCTFIG